MIRGLGQEERVVWFRDSWCLTGSERCVAGCKQGGRPDRTLDGPDCARMVCPVKLRRDDGTGELRQGMEEGGRNKDMRKGNLR